MNLSILETTIKYPEPATRYLIEEDTRCGFEVVAIANTLQEAQALYDSLTNQEAKHV